MENKTYNLQKTGDELRDAITYASENKKKIAEQGDDIEKLKTDLEIVSGNILGIKDTLQPHIDNLNNPHDVTKEDVGLGNVDNTSDMYKQLSIPQKEALDAGLSTLHEKIGAEIDELVSDKADAIIVKTEEATKPLALAGSQEAKLINYNIYGNSTQTYDKDTPPSPENPIDIISVGDLVTDENATEEEISNNKVGKYKIPVTVYGKNLAVRDANYSRTSSYYLKDENGDSVIDFTINHNGSVTIPTQDLSGVKDAYASVIWQSIPFKVTQDNIHLSLSCEGKNDSIKTEIYKVDDINGDVDSDIFVGNSLVDYACSKGDIFYVVISINSDSEVVGTTLYPQLEIINPSIGLGYTNYEQAKAPKTYSIYLNEPLCKLDDHQDYIDFESGKVYRRCKMERVTSAFSINIAHSGSSVGKTIKSIERFMLPCKYGIFSDSKGEGRVICNMFREAFTSIGDESSEKISGKTAANVIYVTISLDRIGMGEYIGQTCTDDIKKQLLKAFKTWLDSNNCIIIYKLKPEYQTEEVIDLPKISSTYNNTYIFCDGDMKATYYMHSQGAYDELLSKIEKRVHPDSVNSFTGYNHIYGTFDFKYNSKLVFDKDASIIAGTKDITDSLINLNDTTNKVEEFESKVTTVEDNLSQIIVDKPPTLTFIQGGISSSTGDFTGETDVNYNNRIYTPEYYESKPYKVSITSGYYYYIYYYDEDKNYIGNSGKWLNETSIAETVITKDGESINVDCIRFLMRNTNGATAITPDKGEMLSITLDGQTDGINNEFIDTITKGVNESIDSLKNGLSKLEDERFFINPEEWEIGTIRSSSGANFSQNNRLRTINFTEAGNYHFSVEEGYKYIIYYYGDNYEYLYNSGSFTALPCLIDPNEEIKYFRILLSEKEDTKITDIDSIINKIIVTKEEHLDELCDYIGKKNTSDEFIESVAEAVKEELSSDYSDYESVMPENIGVLNTILNFKQMLEIEYTTKDVIPGVEGMDFSANTTHKALPYSSTRIDGSFVPNNTSFHTFMTAIQNPNSYLYTVDLGTLGNENGRTYYGAVCSTACGYALGLIPLYTSYQWKDIPGMEVVDITDAYDLKLGDTMWEPGHVSMITDITKNKRGKIGHITISEWWWPKGRSIDYTVDEFMNKYNTTTSNQHPAIYRYSKINTVKHVQNPYVAVEDEVPQTVTYNTDIIPRKGDKANWPKGVDIEIDLLSKDNYQSCTLFKDDEVIGIYTFAGNSFEIMGGTDSYKCTLNDKLLTISGLEAGTYKAHLDGAIDGGNASDFCYWMVVDVTSKATPVGSDGKVKVDFSCSSNAKPYYVQWAGGTKNGTKYISLLSDEDIINGSAISAYQAGTYKVRVAFKTDYGIIFSTLPEAITVT